MSDHSLRDVQAKESPGRISEAQKSALVGPSQVSQSIYLLPKSYIFDLTYLTNTNHNTMPWKIFIVESASDD